MSQPLKDAVSICKTIMRNGFDAYVINARLQEKILEGGAEREIDICTDADFEDLSKLFPHFDPGVTPEVTGTIKEGGVLIRVYPADAEDGSHPEESVAKFTPGMIKALEKTEGALPLQLACPYMPKAKELYDGFADVGAGEIRFQGLPDETLKQNYLRGLRALRFAANFQLPIEPNSWMTIVRSAQRILDYVSVSDIMDEWRKVEAENMWYFVKLLYESTILHGLVPEVAALSRVRQIKNPEEGEEVVLDHTLELMRRYPEELPYDWYGTLGCLFHDVGKLYTAEYVGGQWTFYQHHRVGAKVARKILNRLRFSPEEIDNICHLVRNHMRFHFMLTDRGIRRFTALDDYPRLIEIARADIKARNGAYKEFNHNMKMLERAEIPEEALEPLLNGHEIMDFAEIKPGPAVGLIREALLQAQIAGEVTSVPDAVEFVRTYRQKEQLQ
ncbi:MAG: HD domain-containing protein [Desulfovibrionales bacterium]|nr:MAG: HD domain-containing protein [Desulfovibrionales bacterium]